MKSLFVIFSSLALLLSSSLVFAQCQTGNCEHAPISGGMTYKDAEKAFEHAHAPTPAQFEGKWNWVAFTLINQELSKNLP